MAKLLILTGCLVIIAFFACSDGARSSGFRSSSIRSYRSYRSGYRSFGSFRSSSRNTWVFYGSSGYIYGYGYYSRTRRYNVNTEPTICRNEFDNFMENGTNYEWFICPNMTLADEYNYCCGAEDKEYCCRYWDAPGRIAGFVVGLVVACVFIIIILFVVCRKRQPMKSLLDRMSTRRAEPSYGYTLTSSAPLSTDAGHNVPPDTLSNMSKPPPSYNQVSGQESAPFPEPGQFISPYSPPQPYQASYPPADGLYPSAKYGIVSSVEPADLHYGAQPAPHQTGPAPYQTGPTPYQTGPAPYQTGPAP